MYTSATDLINSTYESTANSGSTASSELGQDAFLNLLIAQLEWQDPMDPMDDTEMVAQLAQFSALESQREMNDQLDATLELLNQQIYMSATTYIGKEVEAAGSSMSKDGDTVSSVTFTLAGDAEEVTAHIINEDGDIVASVDLGSQEEGEHSFVWDGKDADGNVAEDGQYAIAFTAYDANDESVYVATAVSGTVRSVYVENGNTMLELSDGRIVNAANVSRVVDTSIAADGGDEEQ